MGNVHLQRAGSLGGADYLGEIRVGQGHQRWPGPLIAPACLAGPISHLNQALTSDQNATEFAYNKKYLLLGLSDQPNSPPKQTPLWETSQQVACGAQSHDKGNFLVDANACWHQPEEIPIMFPFSMLCLKRFKFYHI